MLIIYHENFPKSEDSRDKWMIQYFVSYSKVTENWLVALLKSANVSVHNLPFLLVVDADAQKWS